MIVCVCNAVCQREIEMLIASGVDTPDAIERHCGAGGDCGTCRPDVQNLIERGAARACHARSLPVLQPTDRAA
jgi:assimilatory nitrate reductase catalytic subunit